MPSLRITAVAALATAALVVPASAQAVGNPTPLQVLSAGDPATASTKDEAATAAAIGNPATLQLSKGEWTFCATEGARCEFTGTRQVRYGANGKFTAPLTVTGGVACNNAVFGDPVPYVVKQCQVTAASQMKDEAATAAAIMAQQQQMEELSRQSEMATNVVAASANAVDKMAAGVGAVRPTQPAAPQPPRPGNEAVAKMAANIGP